MVWINYRKKMKQHDLKLINRVQKDIDELSRLDDDKLLSILKTNLSGSEMDVLSKNLHRFGSLFLRAADTVTQARKDGLLQHAQNQVDLFETWLSQRLIISAEETARLLQISRQALYKARQANRMFSFVRAGQHFYPAFFVDETLEQVQVQQVCKALGNLPAGGKWQFFNTPSYSMHSKTPIEALRAGKYEMVLRLAKAFSDL